MKFLTKQKMKNLFLLFIPYCLFVLAACQYSTRYKMPEEKDMEQLLQKNPDSLATILEEKINANTLSDSDKANYAFWLTKTHIKQNRSLINDTLIHYAVAYYTKTASPHLLDASLLAAEQINWSDTARRQQEQALNETMQIAIRQNDTAVIQQVCSLLAGLYEIPADSGKIKNLIAVTRKYAKDDVATYTNLIGQFGLLSQRDSVLFYTRKGIESAQNLHDSLWEFELTRDYANMLSASGNGKEALSILRD
jgi:hypothetical protein